MRPADEVSAGGRAAHEPIGEALAAAGQVRARIAGARRLPPIRGDWQGRRDPIQRDVRRHRARGGASILVRSIGNYTTEFVGVDWAVADALIFLQARYHRAPTGGAWLCRTDFADDVMALLEVRGFTVESIL